MKKILLLAMSIAIAFGANTAAAQDRLAFTITPPLIKNNVQPGQLWQSAIRVVNNNTEELTVYAQVRDFTGGGEGGAVNFLDTGGATTSGRYLSGWIVIEKGPIKVPAQGSVDLPFIIDVPETADPGGHYAAILVGTQPPAAAEGSSIKVSSIIGSLLLLSVDGDVNEAGDIREFSTGRAWYGDGPVDFSVRFENKGNVHILPQGAIKVFDWWGEERANLALNHNADSGNVLPGDVRRFETSWDADLGFFDQGRYRAQLVVGYGEQARETADRSLFFWFILPKQIGLVAGVLSAFLLLFWLLVRAYVRRAIKGAAGYAEPSLPPVPPSVAAADRSGDEELPVSVPPGKPASGWRWFKLAVIGAAVLLLALAAAIYWQSLKPGGPEVMILAPDQAAPAPGQRDGSISVLEVNEPEPALEAPVTPAEPVPAEESAPEPGRTDLASARVRVENGSGRAGLAGSVAERLRAAGFTVESTGNADNYNYNATVIRHPKAAADVAAAIRDALGKKGELEEVAGTDAITVVAGKDL